MRTPQKKTEDGTAKKHGLPKRFTGIAVAGISFQAGSAAVDSATIMSALVFQLTGNPILVGAVTTILRVGWLLPQLVVGFLAQNRQSSMGYYKLGAFGRASCLALLALLLALSPDLSQNNLAVLVMILWTIYAFVSGIVAVPYNDIVARSLPSNRRSSLLAIRFFGGGILALAVVVLADLSVDSLPFPVSYAAITAMAASLMFISSIVFVSVGEPESPKSKIIKWSFCEFLADGLVVFRKDRRFRLFAYAQWCGGAVLMALPFYVVQASYNGLNLEDVALLLGAQTIGALTSNPLWGWWGDHMGKSHLLQTISLGRMIPPTMVLLIGFAFPIQGQALLIAYLAIFFLLGALTNGLTIAVIGYLMEISPDDRRPAYSGYFNALTAPAFLLPWIGGYFATTVGLIPVFTVSLLAAIAQFLTIRLMRIVKPA